jgi:hypothetical protein
MATITASGSSTCRQRNRQAKNIPIGIPTRSGSRSVKP